MARYRSYNYSQGVLLPISLVGHQGLGLAFCHPWGIRGTKGKGDGFIFDIPGGQ